MLILSPVVLFQSAHKELAAEHAANVRSSKLNTVLTFTMAEMAHGNATSEELKGARDFIRTFLNMGEKPAVLKQTAPPKELRTDFERAQDAAEKKKKGESK